MPGARILGAPSGMLSAKRKAYSRLALHFGMPETTIPQELVEKIGKQSKLILLILLILLL